MNTGMSREGGEVEKPSYSSEELGSKCLSSVLARDPPAEDCPGASDSSSSCFILLVWLVVVDWSGKIGRRKKSRKRLTFPADSYRVDINAAGS